MRNRIRDSKFRCNDCKNLFNVNDFRGTCDVHLILVEEDDYICDEFIDSNLEDDEE